MRILGRGWEGLPQLSKQLYLETYFKPGESYSEWLERIVRPHQNDQAHGDRMIGYFHNYWYHSSTPISSGRGLPISCYVSHIPDSREGIFSGYFEGMWLGAEGGGRGVYWSEVRPAGSVISGTKSYSAGIIPFLGISDRQTYGISQAGTRRSTEAAYVRVEHADIKDFIEIRKETGDPNRRTPNLHHAVVISDAFMHAVTHLLPWDLIDVHTGKVVETVDAYDLWIDILLTRKTETGEPFLLFIDTVNNNTPQEYKTLDLKVSSSNICTEITLYTDKDTTSVCNLGSINLEIWDEYKDDLDQFLADVSDFHDNVNNTFLAMTAGIEEALDRYKLTRDNRDELMRLLAFERARKAVIDERNIGIGVMGFHSLLQSKRIPMDSAMAVGINKTIFSKMRASLEKHQLEVNDPCPMAKRAGTHKRNIHLMAIAPTMSISNLCNLASSGIEPWVANSFVKKLIQGTFYVRNKYLEEDIKEHAQVNGLNDDWIEEQWQIIDANAGSCQTLEWLDDYLKAVYFTAYEINQLALIKLAGDRQPDIDQSQSLNLFFPAECSYEELYTVHVAAWQQGLKSLYYLRSEPETNANTSNRERKAITLEDDVCIACT